MSLIMSIVLNMVGMELLVIFSKMLKDCFFMLGIQPWNTVIGVSSFSTAKGSYDSLIPFRLEQLLSGMMQNGGSSWLDARFESEELRCQR